ncbi:MAG: DUF2085 domain-containing protein [Myxococcaceae bacterium]
MFLLSHHHPAEYHRTYRVGPVRLCARCLGTYPVMALGIALQFALRAPLTHPADPFLALAFTLPALLDWAVGHFRPHAGSNALRTATGVLLGISLARTLFVHLQRPFHLWLLLQAGLVTAVALPVILATYRRRRGV